MTLVLNFLCPLWFSGILLPALIPRGYVAESKTGGLPCGLGKQASSCDHKDVLTGRLVTKLGGI